MPRYYVIEREIPGIGGMAPRELGEAARTSNDAIAQVPGVRWKHSYVAANKTFCIYIAENEQQIREHARISGFPADRITEISGVIDPVTEQLCS